MVIFHSYVSLPEGKHGAMFEKMGLLLRKLQGAALPFFQTGAFLPGEKALLQGH